MLRPDGDEDFVRSRPDSAPRKQAGLDLLDEQWIVRVDQVA